MGGFKLPPCKYPKCTLSATTEGFCGWHHGRPLPAAEAKASPSPSCPVCRTLLTEAPGIGLYCPNPKCEVSDDSALYEAPPSLDAEMKAGIRKINALLQGTAPNPSSGPSLDAEALGPRGLLMLAVHQLALQGRGSEDPVVRMLVRADHLLLHPESPQGGGKNENH